MRKIVLDASPFSTHGCTDFALFEVDGDKAVCVEAHSCSGCWQTGCDGNYKYACVGEVRTPEDVLSHPHRDFEWEEAHGEGIEL